MQSNTIKSEFTKAFFKFTTKKAKWKENFNLHSKDKIFCIRSEGNESRMCKRKRYPK